MSSDDGPQRGGHATTTAPPPSPVASDAATAARRTALRGVVTTVVVTAVLVAVDLAYRLRGGVEDDPTSRAKMDEDGSYAEITAYVAMIAAAIVLARRALTLPRSPVLWAWAGMLLVVTADDMLMLHETVGGALARNLGWSERFGLDAQGWGELAFWAVLGLAVGAALLVTYLRSGPVARRASGYLLACVVVLGVSAVGVDMVAIVVEPSVGGTVSWLVAAAESSGELIAAGLFLTVAVALLVATRPAPAPAPAHAG